jgi:PAS domain S-box-containing protein
LLKYIYLYLIFVLLFFAGANKSYAQLKTSDKANWIVQNIANSTIWSNERAIKSFEIGVYGSPEMFTELKRLSADGLIKNKPFSVINFKRIKDITSTHILYISNEAIESMPEILKVLGDNTLFITDSYPGREYMVNFLERSAQGRHIDIDPANARASGIKFADELLVYAGKPDILRGVFTKTEKSIRETKKKLEDQKIRIEEQRKDVLKLIAENKLEREEIDKQKAINQSQRVEIEKQKQEIDQQRQRLEEVQRTLAAQMEELNRNTIYLRHQEQKIREQEAEIGARRKEIEQQEKEIESNKKEIQTKNLILGRQYTQIQLQKRALFGFSILIGLIVILAIFIWRSYQIKQKINEELRYKNIAINRQKEEIQNRNQQTELLNKELEKLSIVAAQTDNAVTIMDKNGNFEWVNVGFTRIYGYTLQLLKNERDENILGASENDDIKNIVQKCLTEKKTVNFESQNNTRNGKKIWVQTSLTPILDETGEISKLITIETDITKLKKAEEEIRKQHEKIVEQSIELESTNKELEKLSLVASETENAIAIMDSAGNYQWINTGYSRLFGYTFSQLTNEYSRNLITKDTPRDIILLIKKCIEEIVPVTYELLTKSRENTKIWVQTTLTPIVDKKNTIKSLISISSDISKLKFAEQEIRQQSEELIAQKEELIIQKNHIEQQNTDIRSSISYAKTIQSAILPPEKGLNSQFQSFVLYRPKDIVSGDFYWYAHHPSKNGTSEKHFVAVVDCTGHGVPGAFMSMIGSQMLNEIVNEKGIAVPSQILETMNREIIQTLKQNEGENNDGMDVCLVTIQKLDNNRAKVIFSGAKRPLFHFHASENKLYYIKGTRKTIGGTQAKRNKEIFTDHQLLLNQGDTIYLSTDGIVDQPSADRIRFGSLRLIQILKMIGPKPILEQKIALENALNNYQKHEQQRDDVTFIGIKI